MTIYIQAPFRYMEIIEEKVFKRKLSIKEFIVLMEDFITFCATYAMGMFINSKSYSSDNENEVITNIIHALLGDLLLTSHHCTIVEIVQEFKCVVNTIKGKLGDEFSSCTGNTRSIRCYIKGSIVKIEIE